MGGVLTDKAGLISEKRNIDQNENTLGSAPLDLHDLHSLT